MNNIQGLKKRLGVVGISSIVELLLGFSLFMLISYSLSENEYASYVIFTQIFAFFSIVSGLGLDVFLITEYNRASNQDYSKLVSSIFFLRTAILLLISVTFLLSLYVSPKIVFFGLTVEHMLIGAIIGVAYSIVGGFVSISKIRERVFTLAMAKILPIFSFLVVLLFLFRFDQVNLTKLFYVNLTTILAVSLFLLISIFYEYGTKFGIEKILGSVKTSSPAIIYSFALLGLIASDRFIIGSELGVKDIPAYSFSYIVATYIAHAGAVIETSYSPLFYRLESKGEFKRIQTLSPILIEFFSIVSMVLGSLAVFVVADLGPNQYSSGAEFIPPLTAAGFFYISSTIVMKPLWLNSRISYIAAISVFALLTNVSLNLILMPRFGVIVAAWTTLAAYLAFFSIFSISSQKLLYLNTPLVKSLFLGLICYFSTLMIVLFNEKTVFSPAMVLLVVIPWALIRRQEFLNAWDIAKKS